MKKSYLHAILYFIEKNSVLKHVFLSCFVLFMLFFIWIFLLDIYTMHNKHIMVPNYINVNISKIDSISEANNLRYVIIDSIFDRNREKGIVVNQIPKDSSHVKKNRCIYLTINAVKSKKISFPDIYDFSLRQAIRKLKQFDLEIGQLYYKPDIAINKVLAFEINGIPINPGQELYVGSVIDLILGKGLSQEKVVVPNLLGLNRSEANLILKSKSLNIGLEIFDTDITDSAQAVIYKQYPFSREDNMLNIGSSIDLYFNNPE